ncbi:MAG: hypothetical protein ACRELD_10165 [Longimicrobiales bacterium]
MPRLFLLSPASCAGARARMLLRDAADFELARRIRSPAGAPIGDVFSFLSGLYFRGKLDYARAFARTAPALPGTLVITANAGVIAADTLIGIEGLRAAASVPIDLTEPRYRQPLEATVAELARQAPPDTQFVLLGSIATGKYIDVLHALLGDRLRFPAAFIGRGDMSRGGLLLRCVREGRELDYIGVDGAVRRGRRPPRLEPLRRRPA